MKWLERLPYSLLHVVFLMLMLLSVFLYKERLFADAAYYFFHSVNKGWFHIEADRITIALSQLFPLLGYYMGFPLKLLMVMSSLGHELFFYGLFLLVSYKLKNKSAAITILLIHLIGQLWLYYMPFLEMSYGAALAIVFYALLRSDKWQDDKWMILLLIVEWLVLFSHPENLYLIPVLILFDYLSRGFIKSIHFPTVAAFLLGVVVKLLNFSQYDQQKLGSSLNAVKENNSTEQYVLEVLEVYTAYYPEVLLFAVLTIGFLIMNKSWKKLMFVMGTLGVLMFIINKIEDTNTFYWYTEVVNAPIVFLVLFFFMMEVYSPAKQLIKNVITVVLVVLLFIRISWIWNYGEPMRNRTAQLERLVDYAQMLGHSKYMIQSQNFEKNYSFVNWANPMETLLYSAIDGKEHTVSIINEKDLAYRSNKRELDQTNFLLRKFNIEPISFLNQQLFELDKENYHVLNHAGFSRPYQEVAQGISIEPLLSNSLTLLNADDTAYVRVKIKNDTEVALPSGEEEQIFLSYHWLKDGVDYHWDGLRTPLEVDVYHQYSQDIRIHSPQEKGVYQLQFDIVLEGRDWFGLEEKYEVIVH